MSYSFQEPEEQPVCECKYDEFHDRMDRDDCPFHADMIDDTPTMQAVGTKRKPTTTEIETGGARKRRKKTA